MHQCLCMDVLMYVCMQVDMYTCMYIIYGCRLTGISVCLYQPGMIFHGYIHLCMYVCVLEHNRLASM